MCTVVLEVATNHYIVIDLYIAPHASFRVKEKKVASVKIPALLIYLS
jgi:hypothetical protein